MKKTMYILFTTAVFVACTKDRLMYNETQYQAVNLSASLIQTTSILGLLAGEAAISTADTGAVRGIPFSREIADGEELYVLYFGDTTDTDFDGRKRAGILTISGKHGFPNSPDTLLLSLHDFMENGIAYAGEISDIESGSSTQVKNLYSNALSITSGKNTVRANMNAVMQTFASENLLIQASYRTTFTGDQEFAISTKSNLQLLTNTHCFEKGEFEVTTAEDQILVNCGDGTPDGLATATSEGFRYILNLNQF